MNSKCINCAQILHSLIRSHSVGSGLAKYEIVHKLTLLIYVHNKWRYFIKSCCITIITRIYTKCPDKNKYIAGKVFIKQLNFVHLFYWYFIIINHVCLELAVFLTLLFHLLHNINMIVSLLFVDPLFQQMQCNISQ